MKSIPALFAILLCASCANSVKEQHPQYIANVEPELHTPLKSVHEPQVKPQNTASPSGRFLKLAVYMDSCGYKVDTARTGNSFYYSKTYSNTRTGNFGGLIFYKVLFEEHPIYRELQNEKAASLQTGHKGSMLKVPYEDVYFSIFKKATAIWAYCWKVKAEAKPDGAVEEWTFNSSKDARTAYRFLKSQEEPLSWPYFKIGAFYRHEGTRLYIFHASMTGFNLRNRQFYKWLERHPY